MGRGWNCPCSCVVHPHIFGLQKILAAFIPVEVWHHFRVDTGVVSAGQNGHVHTGVDGALQLVCDLSYLFVRACAKEDLGNPLFIVFGLLLSGVFG